MGPVRLPQDKEGFLYKKSPSLFVGWQERYAILKERKLKYFKSNSAEDLAVPQGVLNFDHFNCTVEKCDDKDGILFNIHIMGIDDRTFQFKAQNKQDAINWQIEL